MKKIVSAVLCVVIIWSAVPRLHAQSALQAAYSWDYTSQWDPMSEWSAWWTFGDNGRYSETAFSLVNPAYPNATIYVHNYIWTGYIGSLGDYDSAEYDAVSIYDSSTGHWYFPRNSIWTWHEFRAGTVDGNGIAHDQDTVTWTPSNGVTYTHTNYINVDANYRDYLLSLDPQDLMNTLFACPTCGQYSKVETQPKGWLARLKELFVPVAHAQGGPGPWSWYSFAGNCGVYAVGACAFFDDVAMFLPYGAAAAGACVAAATATCIGIILSGGNVPGISWGQA